MRRPQRNAFTAKDPLHNCRAGSTASTSCAMILQAKCTGNYGVHRFVLVACCRSEPRSDNSRIGGRFSTAEEPTYATVACNLASFPYFASECWEDFNRSKPATEKCSQCGEPLAIVAGKFSGNYIQLENGIKLHGTPSLAC